MFSFAALSGRAPATGPRPFRPNPLNAYCWFTLEQGNYGSLQFSASSEKEEEESLEVATGPAAPAAGTAAHRIKGRIQYRDTREELTTIKNDPSALRDVFVAKFVDSYGRAAAEMVRRTIEESGVFFEVITYMKCMKC